MSLKKRGPHKKKFDKVIKFHFYCALLKYHLYPGLNSLSHTKKQLFINKNVVTCGMFFKSGITHRRGRNQRALGPFFGNTGFYLHANTLFITGCNG